MSRTYDIDVNVNFGKARKYSKELYAGFDDRMSRITSAVSSAARESTEEALRTLHNAVRYAAPIMHAKTYTATYTDEFDKKRTRTFHGTTTHRHDAGFLKNSVVWVDPDGKLHGFNSSKSTNYIKIDPNALQEELALEDTVMHLPRKQTSTSGYVAVYAIPALVAAEDRHKLPESYTDGGSRYHNYARDVEYGSRSQAAQPFFRSTTESFKASAEAQIGAAVVKRAKELLK